MKKEKRVSKSTVTGILVVVAVVIIASIIAKLSIAVIPAGYVGVQYNMNGGVEGKPLTQGWNFKSPKVHVTNYTVSIEQSYLTSNDKGDSPSDESFSASSKEGKAMQVELAFSYQYDAKTVNKVFTEFRGQSGTEVRDYFIKPNMVSWSKEVLARYAVSDILGDKRADVNTALTEYVANKFDKYYIKISNVSLSNVTVDEETQKAINNKIQAQQNAETQTIKNQTAIDKANADAKVKKTKAQAEAEAKLIEAKAEAEANKKLNGSITDNLIKMKEAEARLKHGWVTVNGADTVVTDASSDEDK